MATNELFKSMRIVDNNDSTAVNRMIAIKSELQNHVKSLVDKIRQLESGLLQELDDSIEHYKACAEATDDAKICETDRKRKRTPSTLHTPEAKIKKCTLDDDLSCEISKKNDTNKNLLNPDIKLVWDYGVEKQLLSSVAKLESDQEKDTDELGTMAINYRSKIKPILSVTHKGWVYKNSPDIGKPLNCPWGLAIDPQTNNIYVMDSCSHSRVCVFSSEGEYRFQFGFEDDNYDEDDADDGTVRVYEGKMNTPYGIAIDKGKIFVSQQGSHCVLIYKVDGTFIQKLGSEGKGVDQFKDPRGIAISHLNGDVYVCDYMNCRIHVFDEALKHKFFIRNDKFKSPYDVKLNREGAVFILDASDPCFHMYDNKHNYIKSILHRGQQGGDVFGSQSFIIDAAGTFIFSEPQLGYVRFFSKSGVLFHQIGDNSGVMFLPHGIAIDYKGRLVLANRNKQAFLQFY